MQSVFIPRLIRLHPVIYKASLLLALWVALSARLAVAAPSILVEAEPNDQPAQAQRIGGEVSIAGELEGNDQDGFLWQVSDVDAANVWTLELEGLPDAQTRVDIVRINWTEDGAAVAGTTRLLSVLAPDGQRPTRVDNLLFEPGEYFLGVSQAGGSGSYRLKISHGKRFIGPYDLTSEKEEKRRVSLNKSFRNAYYLTGDSGRIDWVLPADAEQSRWELGFFAPLGRHPEIELIDPQGQSLLRQRIDALGRLQLVDLGLMPGHYQLQIIPDAGEEGLLFGLDAKIGGKRIDGSEAEPNNSAALANRVDFSQPVSGRLSDRPDEDVFQFSVDERLSARRLQVHLTSDSGADLKLCLHDNAFTRLQCRNGAGVINLEDLRLSTGDYFLATSRGGEPLDYQISLVDQGEFEPGREAEPNDELGFASGMGEERTIRGRFTPEDSDRDTDNFQFTVSGEPQLWRFQAVGDGILSLSYLNAKGGDAQNVGLSGGERRARLSNLFLLPGRHQLRLVGKQGDYVLRAIPLGAPDPNAEREPNDDLSTSHRLDWGVERSGLLEDGHDMDAYRFHLSASEHIRLTVTPAADAVLKAYLFWDEWNFQETHSPKDIAGEPIVLDGIYKPGDYRLALRAVVPSEAEYSVKLERLSLIDCAVDCEPNDGYAFFNELPADFHLVGRVGEWRDDDWFRLPQSSRGTQLHIVSLKDDARPGIQTADRRVVRMQRSERPASDAPEAPKLVEWSALLPSDEDAFVVVNGRANYDWQLSFDDGPQPKPLPSKPSVTLGLQPERDSVAAYASVGQRVAGRVTLRNDGDQSQSLDLQLSTSQDGWRLYWSDSAGRRAGQSLQVELEAGASRELPLLLDVLPDAWPDLDVMLRVVATDANGGRLLSEAPIRAHRDQAAIDPLRAWTLPDAMLGGLNVAATVLGAKRVGGEDLQDGRICRDADQLFDGMTPLGEGMGCRGGTAVNPAVTIDLAGDAPVPVAGFTLNPKGRRSAFGMASHFRIELSPDGLVFNTVLEDRIQAIPTEQVFALASPVSAKQARLTLFDTQSGQGSIGLGEWKVIASPGVETDAPDGGDDSRRIGRDLATPALGGHVVWAEPNVSANDWNRSLLDETKQQPSRTFKPGQRADVVVGFHHDRAARIDSVAWDMGEAPRGPGFAEVDVSVSTDSPLGPWVAVGRIVSAEDPAPEKLTFDEPVWARFVRFSAEPSGLAYYPNRIRVFEHPTAGDYRSILAEWGEQSFESYYETLRPVQPKSLQRVPSTNTHRDTAQLLPLAQTVAGQVRLGGSEQWFGVVIPPGHNTLILALSGDPSLRVEARMEDESGAPVSLLSIQSTPTHELFSASVEPGASYYIVVSEPPRSVIFSWDTSGSVGPFLPQIYAALSAFAEDVKPGREVVNLLPYGGGLLLEQWSGQPYTLRTVLADYPRRDDSSNSEGSIVKASQALEERSGTRAIVLITDAATNQDGKLWPTLHESRPRIFTLGVPSNGAFGRNPPHEEDLLEDWARVDGGYYSRLTTVGSMERGFDRAATLLRRPADFTLRVDSRFEKAPGPGLLSVKSGSKTTASSSGAIELILDASGSMLQRINGVRRIDLARSTLDKVVTEQLPAGTMVALRVFGHKQPNACRTDLEAPLAPLDPKSMKRIIAGISAKNLARTPIADSLKAVAGDLDGVKGRKVVVLLTDGEETCDGDPAAAIAALKAKGIDVRVNIVGFAIDDAALAEQFSDWAEQGGGRYFAANDGEALDQAMQQALKVSYTVSDSAGNAVATGWLDGEPLSLPQGVYSVKVDGDLPLEFPRVELRGQQAMVLDLDEAAGR